jgi:hypothetical protein
MHEATRYSFLLRLCAPSWLKILQYFGKFQPLKSKCSGPAGGSVRNEFYWYNRYMGLGDTFLSIKSRVIRIGARFFKRSREILRSHTRLVLICLGAFGVILGLLVVLEAANYQRRRQADPPQPLSDAFGPLPIPPEELFLPDEPDFLPEVLWEREPREFWTPEDALPFWTDPLENNRRVWQERAEGMIDELLERLP